MMYFFDSFSFACFVIVLAGQVSAKSLAVSQPSLRDLRSSATLTRHWRAGLSSNVPSGLNPWQPSVTACRLGGAFLLHGLGMGFDKPQAFVYAAGNFGEDVGGVLVVQSVGLVNALRRPLHRKGFHAVTGCNAASGSTSRAMVCAFSYPHASATREQRRPPPREPVKLPPQFFTGSNHPSPPSRPASNCGTRMVRRFNGAENFLFYSKL